MILKGTPSQQGVPPGPSVKHKPHPNTCLHSREVKLKPQLSGRKQQQITVQVLFLRGEGEVCVRMG